ncbi:hypothetical protein EIN43_19595 [Enterobacter hormaechei]|uniref:Uncharacterized protein n=1 Tax=Enterobacter hormaechei TaxID=158836 RepID=A0A4Y5ZPC4_9ENTR|nr:hypothetical protein EIN43_19595 [Enterobacter hormaechei]
MTAFERADFSRESDLIKSFQKILSTIAGFNVMQITLRCRVNNRLRGNNCFNLVKLGKDWSGFILLFRIKPFAFILRFVKEFSCSNQHWRLLQLCLLFLPFPLLRWQPKETLTSC